MSVTTAELDADARIDGLIGTLASRAERDREFTERGAALRF